MSDIKGKLEMKLGKDGVGIKSIEQIAAPTESDAENLVVITLTDDRTIELVIRNGSQGYTPQKGIDYNDGYTPQKGIDYFDGEPGYTPQKGIDYFDGEPGYTPQKGIDYFDGESFTVLGSVGQFLTVGAVDSEGKATEIKAVTIPTAKGVSF